MVKKELRLQNQCWGLIGTKDDSALLVPIPLWVVGCHRWGRREGQDMHWITNFSLLKKNLLLLQLRITYSILFQPFMPLLAPPQSFPLHSITSNVSPGLPSLLLYFISPSSFGSTSFPLPSLGVHSAVIFAHLLLSIREVYTLPIVLMLRTRLLAQ